MRDEVHAARILEATVKAVDLPVTLKMRTGWDDRNRNAPRAGADRRSLRHPHDHGAWPHPLPVLRRQRRLALHPRGQGGGVDPGHRQRRHQHASTTPTGRSPKCGADGVMIGRGCYGRPWFVAPGHRVAAQSPAAARPAARKRNTRSCCEHYDDDAEPLRHRRRGASIARKHIGWYSKGLAGLGRVPRRGQPDRRAVPRVKALIRAFYEPLDRARGGLMIGSLRRGRASGASALSIRRRCLRRCPTR